MEGAGMLRDLLQRKDWLVSIYRPERCLLLYSDSRRRQEVPTLSVERADIQVSVSPLLALHCTQSFYKAPETSNNHSEMTRNIHNNYSGWPVNNEIIKGRAGKSYNSCNSWGLWSTMRNLCSPQVTPFNSWVSLWTQHHCAIEICKG